MKGSMRMRSVVEPFDEDPEDPDGDRKKGAAQWSAGWLPSHGRLAALPPTHIP